MQEQLPSSLLSFPFSSRNKPLLSTRTVSDAISTATNNCQNVLAFYIIHGAIFSEQSSSCNLLQQTILLLSIVYSLIIDHVSY